MKKYFTVFSIVLILSVSSLFAERYCLKLGAYSPEQVTFEESGESFVLKTNSIHLNYGFYDSFGRITDAESASFLSIVSE